MIKRYLRLIVVVLVMVFASSVGMVAVSAIPHRRTQHERLEGGLVDVKK